ncbi:MAG: hypothetical protein ACJ8MO_39070 [Bacillus sp. (in: firmicutes)]
MGLHRSAEDSDDLVGVFFYGYELFFRNKKPGVEPRLVIVGERLHLLAQIPAQEPLFRYPF